MGAIYVNRREYDFVVKSFVKCTNNKAASGRGAFNLDWFLFRVTADLSIWDWKQTRTEWYWRKREEIVEDAYNLGQNPTTAIKQLLYNLVRKYRAEKGMSEFVSTFLT